MKALLKVGYGCNENCTFCHTRDVREVQGSAAEVSAKIRRAKALGHDMVVLSGGEATIRPELLAWAAEISALGMELGLVTNGLVLAYPELLDRLLALRLRYVYMSLHGGEERIHNLLVRAHSFAQATAAIRNLSGRGLQLTINCVVTRQNVDHLLGVVDALLPFPDLTLKFSCVQPKGGGEELYQKLAVPVAQGAAKVLAALRHGVERAGALGPRFAHDGFPLCLLPGFEQSFDDLKTHGYATMVEVGEPDYFPVDDVARLHPPACDGCALRGPCPGLFRGYHERFGDAELRPRTGLPRSNSFTWVWEGLVSDGLPEDRCPIREDSVTPWDRGRTLFVRNGGRIGRFRSSSRDFTDLEHEQLKHGLGQVYLDVSRKPAPDDFAADLVKLERSALCGPCPERDRCTGLYEPRLEQLFARDDARVRELLSALAGDVLDVGCGEGPYEELLAPAAREGRIRYTGVDPEASRIDELARRWPWASLRVGGAEGLADEESFDHVLVLRSWNHLRDPAAAVAALSRALRPGGVLTVVDNVAFGLARTRQQQERAAASPARFEHFRNDRAADAARLLLGAGLEPLEEREVGPASSNQWLLRFRKGGSMATGSFDSLSGCPTTSLASPRN